MDYGGGNGIAARYVSAEMRIIAVIHQDFVAKARLPESATMIVMCNCACTVQ
jgi:hypothetical protein